MERRPTPSHSLDQWFVLDFVFCVLCVPAYLFIVALSLDSEIALIVLLGAILMCCTTRLGSLVSCSTHIVWSALSFVTFVPTVYRLTFSYHWVHVEGRVVVPSSRS